MKARKVSPPAPLDCREIYNDRIDLPSAQHALDFAIGARDFFYNSNGRLTYAFYLIFVVRLVCSKLISISCSCSSRDGLGGRG